MTSVLEPPTVATEPGQAPRDNSTAQLDVLLSDLTTYRYQVGVPITPSLALRLIGLNADNNRFHKPKVSERYSRDMTTRHKITGEYHWKERTGQTVKIATDGFLVDGLHRMHALARSGRTIKFDLCFGIDRVDMPAIDAGSPRTSADSMRIAGAADLRHVTPIVKRVIAWESGRFMGPSGGAVATNFEVNDRYELDAGLFEAAAERGKDCARRDLANAVAAGTAYFLFAQYPDDKPIADDFFDAVIGGANLSDLSAAFRLREKLRRRKTDKLSPTEQLAYFVRAWNRHNTLTEGSRVPVHHLQLIRSGGDIPEKLGNWNFPPLIRARWTDGDVRAYQGS